MDKLFSERYGYVVKQVQFESLDRTTRSFLWEQVYFSYIKTLEFGLGQGLSDFKMYSEAKNFILNIDREIFKKTSLEAPEKLGNILASCENMFMNGAWYMPFDLIEYLLKTSYILFSVEEQNAFVIKQVSEALNQVLESRKAMYRLVSSLVVPITNGEELATISSTLDETESIKTVQGHIIKALKHLSDRADPDYHNSIKESVSALEALLRLIASKPHATLSDAMREIKKKGVISLNIHLENTIKSLYQWTSDEGAIRHADKGDSSVIDIDDAKFTLITCCSLVNYLTAKSTKAGINLS